MSIIYIPVEVPDNELTDLLAKLTVAQPAQYAPSPTQVIEQQLGGQELPSNVLSVRVAPATDPWTGNAATGAAAPVQPNVIPTSTVPTATPTSQATPAGQTSKPMCAHGPRRFVASGFSQATGKPYSAFWACPTQRGDPSKCQGIPA